MAVLYLILGLSLHDLKKAPVLLLIVYGLTFFCSNFGPNSTTFILPSESFPYEVRTSLNGFCAAAGKLGACIGSFGFKPISNAAGANVAFFLCAAFAVLGFICTALFVEDRRGRGMGGETFLEDGEVPEDAQHIKDRNQVVAST